MGRTGYVMLCMLLPGWISAQTFHISGIVREERKDALPLAHIIVLPDSTTTVTDNRGKFLVNLVRGEHTFITSYTGFRTLTTRINITSDTTIQFQLQPSIDQLEEIVITSQRDRQQELFESTRMSTQVLNPEDVTSIPVLGGEADLIKVLQLMPGSVRGIEGSSDLFVRGGAADQNLVLLDDATIYNTSHLLGFVSVFNPDILESVESVNGGFPASQGGRLSSILDVRTKSEIADDTHVSGDIGLIASRLFVEQPIVDDKLGVWVAGRRTYIDKVMNVINEELPYFFYDLNARALWRPSARDRVSFSYYQGNDDLDIFRDRNNDGVGFLTSFQSGNDNQTLQWDHSINDRWETHVSALRTTYDYSILNAFRDNRLRAFSDIEDVSAKAEAIYRGDIQRNIKIGTQWIRHEVSPSVVNSSGTFSEFLESTTSQGRVSNELAFYGQYEWSPADRWMLNAGLRTSMAIVDDHAYAFPEPRFAARYEINDNEAIKFSYSRMAQYMHRISNSAVTSPTDIWYPVTDSIKPQSGHQFSLGWQRSLPKQNIMMSLEAYYKPMRNLIGLEEGTNLFFNSNFQNSLVQGRGRAYGLEVMVRKNAGRFTGWISYTLAWSHRQFDELNRGEWFASRYDRRHNGAVVAQYEITPRLSVSGVWEFISGSKFTPIIGQYQVVAPSTTGVDLVPVFAPINSVKLTDAHRLDLGIKWRSQPGRKFQYEWFAGVYNAYNRTNPVAITIETDESDGSLRYEQPGLVGLLPFISYGFKF
ncbi:MAG: TonB-dependent receptor [Cyclobacteriaceae bacterium]